MKKHFFIILLLSLSACRWVETKEELKSKELKSMNAPSVKKVNFIHSDDFASRKDPYNWLAIDTRSLIDTTNIESQEIRNHIKAENEFADAKLYASKKQKEELLYEINRFAEEENKSFKFKVDDYFYFYEYQKNQNFPTLFRHKENQEDQKTIVLDFQKESKEKGYFSLGEVKISDNNKYIAYAFDTIGKNEFNVQILDIEKGLTQRTSITNSNGQIAWNRNNKSIYIIEKSETEKTSSRLVHYSFLENQNKRKIIFTGQENNSSLNIKRSKSGRFIFLYEAFKSNHSSYFIDLSKNTVIKPFKTGVTDVIFELEHQENNLIIKTNHNSSYNFKLYKSSFSNLYDETKWEELIGHREDIVIEDIHVFKDFIVAEEKVDGLRKFHIINSETGMGHYADFPEETYSSNLLYNFDYNASEVIYNYSSLSTPQTIYSYNPATRKNKVLRQSNLNKFLKANKYKTERIWATAFDGTKIPVSLVYKSDLNLNSTAPLLISCESSFGKSKDLDFDVNLLSLIDRGFVYAFAHVRGGGYLGEKWHNEGIQLKKKNAITDFISATEFLINKEYADPTKIFTYGKGSDATIIAASVNYEPTLFKGVVLSNPKVDLLSSLFESAISDDLKEWGNPKKEELYYYIKSYSPYENIKANNFPSILVLNGIFNDESKYWESIKWVAKLREFNQSKNEILIRTNLVLNKSNRQGRQKRNEEDATKYAFILSLLN